jgi:heme b synthase
MKREFLPRLVAWELTGRCNLNCVHCRASASDKVDPNELSTEEIKATIDDIAGFCKPILILTGGEPLIREDVFEIARHATEKGLRVVLGTNGTLLTSEVVGKLKDSGVQRVSISIDCAFAEEHDSFRGMRGAYEASLKGIEACKEGGLEFQINTTVTKRNLNELQRIFDQAVELGAVAHHIFLLVPTGRGKVIEDEEIPPEEYERVLNWMYDMQRRMDRKAEKPLHRMFMKATCAPHFIRVIQRRAKKDGSDITLGRHGLDAMSSGCMAGTGFCFISRYGEVNTCGYMPIKAGNIREQPFRDIWENSKLFNDLRDRNNLKGKCGACEYRMLCGGCRARAYARYGDYLAEEPYCIYQPKVMRAGGTSPRARSH